jgi:tRNA uridine 5-carboxymethylaminomethyl modification enzyme
MFTSRAEHRLILRQDNAGLRLFEHAERLGIAAPEDRAEVRRIRSEVRAELHRLERTYGEDGSLAQLLRRPDMTYERLPGRRTDLAQESARQVEIEVKYAGYIERGRRQIERSLKAERQAIPAHLDYDAIRALRYEAREKLKLVRPSNLGQASRIPGVNPADVAVLSVWAKRIHAGP